MRVRDLRSRTRHDHLRQGVIGGDAADLGIAGQREDLPGDARREPQARKFRPRLYLLGAPGRGPAVALEVPRIYEEMDLLGHVGRVGAHMQHALRPLADHPLVGDVRGVGLLAGLDIVVDKETRAMFDPALRVPAIIERNFKKPARILRVIGTRIAPSPPVIITESEGRRTGLTARRRARRHARRRGDLVEDLYDVGPPFEVTAGRLGEPAVPVARHT